MKTKDYRKMAKALELLKRAEALMNEVDQACEEIRYSSNAPFRTSRLESVISIIEADVNHGASLNLSDWMNIRQSVNSEKLTA